MTHVDYQAVATSGDVSLVWERTPTSVKGIARFTGPDGWELAVALARELTAAREAARHGARRRIAGGWLKGGKRAVR